jgi:hypothetical protein
VIWKKLHYRTWVLVPDRDRPLRHKLSSRWRRCTAKSAVCSTRHPHMPGNLSYKTQYPICILYDGYFIDGVTQSNCWGMQSDWLGYLQRTAFASKLLRTKLLRTYGVYWLVFNLYWPWRGYNVWTEVPLSSSVKFIFLRVIKFGNLLSERVDSASTPVKSCHASFMEGVTKYHI